MSCKKLYKCSACFLSIQFWMLNAAGLVWTSWSLIFFPIFWILLNFITFLLKIGYYFGSGSFIWPQWGKTIYEVIYEFTILWLFYHKSNKGWIKSFKINTAVQCINVQMRCNKDFVPIVYKCISASCLLWRGNNAVWKGLLLLYKFHNCNPRDLKAAALIYSRVHNSPPFCLFMK